MMDELLKLAERCEKATGPDRELDALVHCALKGWKFSHLGGEFFGTTQDGERFTVGLPERAAGDTAQTHHRMRTDSLAPRYTASLDAAMTLVPEGALWEVEHKRNMGRKYSELFSKPKGEPDTDFNAGVGMGEVPAHWEYGRSLSSSALALCAAALRARASIEGKS